MENEDQNKITLSIGFIVILLTTIYTLNFFGISSNSDNLIQKIIFIIFLFWLIGSSLILFAFLIIKASEFKKTNKREIAGFKFTKEFEDKVYDKAIDNFILTLILAIFVFLLVKLINLINNLFNIGEIPSLYIAILIIVISFKILEVVLKKIFPKKFINK